MSACMAVRNCRRLCGRHRPRQAGHPSRIHLHLCTARTRQLLASTFSVLNASAATAAMPKVVSRSAVSSSTDGQQVLRSPTSSAVLTSLVPCRSAPHRIINSSATRLLCDMSSLRPSLAAHILFRPDCICGEFIVCSIHLRFTDCPHSPAPSPRQLVIDKSLTALPRRQTDGATIIRCQDSGDAKARVFKLNATPKEPILVERCVAS